MVMIWKLDPSDVTKVPRGPSPNAWPFIVCGHSRGNRSCLTFPVNVRLNQFNDRQMAL